MFWESNSKDDRCTCHTLPLWGKQLTGAWINFWNYSEQDIHVQMLIPVERYISQNLRISITHYCKLQTKFDDQFFSHAKGFDLFRSKVPTTSTCNSPFNEISSMTFYLWNKKLFIWAPSSEFVSSSIPSWQTLTAHAQPFRGARDLAFCLKVLLDSLLVWASSGGSGETARMRRLAWTFAARIGDMYQIRLTRSIWKPFQDYSSPGSGWGLLISD